MKITLRDEVLELSDNRVVVRLGQWDNDRLRDKYDEEQIEAYRTFLADHPELSQQITAKFGGSFFVLSVYVRPGHLEDSPELGGGTVVDEWFKDAPGTQYGKYREAVISGLLEHGHVVLPTDINIPGGTNRPGHFDIVVADTSDATLNELLEHFAVERVNPHKSRPRRPAA